MFESSVSVITFLKLLSGAILAFSTVSLADICPDLSGVYHCVGVDSYAGKKYRFEVKQELVGRTTRYDFKYTSMDGNSTSVASTPQDTLLDIDANIGKSVSYLMDGLPHKSEIQTQDSPSQKVYRTETNSCSPSKLNFLVSFQTGDSYFDTPVNKDAQIAFQWTENRSRSFQFVSTDWQTKNLLLCNPPEPNTEIQAEPCANLPQNSPIGSRCWTTKKILFERVESGWKAANSPAIWHDHVLEGVKFSTAKSFCNLENGMLPTIEMWETAEAQGFREIVRDGWKFGYLYADVFYKNGNRSDPYWYKFDPRSGRLVDLYAASAESGLRANPEAAVRCVTKI